MVDAQNRLFSACRCYLAVALLGTHHHARHRAPPNADWEKAWPRIQACHNKLEVGPLLDGRGARRLPILGAILCAARLGMGYALFPLANAVLFVLLVTLVQLEVHSNL